MNTLTTTERYARVIEVSKRVRWEIERDVIRGRRFDYTKTFMPSGLSLVNELAFLSPADKRLLSQVQGRTYAYIFGLVERFISAKVLDISREHWLGDQVALEALVRMSDEEIKHQKMFRRLEAQMAQDMPAGYMQACATRFSDAQCEHIQQKVLKAYRWQYIVSGVMEPRFQKVLFGLIDEQMATKVKNALAPLTYAIPDQPEMPLPLAA